MSVLMDIISEEKERLIDLIKFYEKEISKYPKGYISKKIVKGHVYYYYSYRDGNTVKNYYLGANSSKEKKEKEEMIKERKRLKILLKKAKNNLKEVERALRAKK